MRLQSNCVWLFSYLTISEKIESPLIQKVYREPLALVDAQFSDRIESEDRLETAGAVDEIWAPACTHLEESQGAAVGAETHYQADHASTPAGGPCLVF